MSLVVQFMQFWPVPMPNPSVPVHTALVLHGIMLAMMSSPASV
ncbi:MAG TPA: hypothetical protein VGB85_04075 [Nannocystis sp.]|jgi:hypothetical protein